MKFKATVPLDPAAQRLFDAFSSPQFRDEILEGVAGECMGAEDASARPAEYMVQEPDRIIVGSDGAWGVHFTISGVSRGNRKPEQFQEALKKTVLICWKTISDCLPPGGKCQLFVVMFVDSDVPAGDGQYSQVLESKPEWVEAKAA